VDGKFLARGPARFRAQGVTYGPFAPGPEGEQFPSPHRVSDDFARMGAAGINSVRTYLLPPEWFLGLADDRGLGVFVDVPWPRHLCFLESERAQAEARRLVGQAAKQGRDHPCLLAYSIGNEIPPDVVRWHGARRVERFVRELADVARQAGPGALVTYTSYPPTEYLDLSFLDFLTFNVYLHDRETFRRYLFRLQNLAGDKPVVLGELGMDTFRHGEQEQADFLAGHVREAILTGLAGGFVFSWTDEWYTGGHPIEDWAFGITHADRRPKASYHALRQAFTSSPAGLLPEVPRVSVVVCSYNGGPTLGQCLRSLFALNYPDYEVIIVDDGSTDDTQAVLSNFPGARVIRQENRGLSAARNAGLRAATGSVIAYTDSDCFADPDWLALLVYQLQRSGAAAVGGPNLSPEDGPLAACVAACPGQPTHVLESEQVAEHIPGCNMAFRREALEAINGFDRQYRKAGDDVDVCWRLQQAGMWITFAPGAFVWHHRRQTPRAYLRQQGGYGEAEALLRFKHPDKFNGRGDGKWRGALYGPSLRGLRVGDAMIYRGTFATGLFQCLYRPAPAHWAMLPSTLEWHLGAALAALAGLFFWPPAWVAAGAMLAFSLAVAALQAAQASLPPQHDGLKARLLIAALCYAQPLVRSWRRYRTRLFAYSLPRYPPPSPDRGPLPPSGRPLPLNGALRVAYWSEEGFTRTELLALVLAYLNEHGWGKAIDSGWEDWDLEVYCHPWTVVRVLTAQEEHGGGRRLIRLGFQLRPSGRFLMTGGLAGLCGVFAALLHSLPFAAAAGLLLAVLAAAWWGGARRAAHAVGLIDACARTFGMLPLGPAAGDPTGPQAPGAEGGAGEALPPEGPGVDGLPECSETIGPVKR
jgi:GT2 family glycosyltransferase